MVGATWIGKLLGVYRLGVHRLGRGLQDDIGCHAVVVYIGVHIGVLLQKCWAMLRALFNIHESCSVCNVSSPSAKNQL